MTDKTLFIHAGGAKTGSSALQNFSHINVSRLESLGFAYENRLNVEHQHEISSGNGMLLYEILASAASPENEIDPIVASYFGRCDSAICSSEFFAELGPIGWKKLYESSLRLGVKLKVIFYVRNVIPFLLSAYDQAIKRHGGHESFDEWVAKAIWQHGRSLKIIAAALPESSMQVIHYDHVRTHLIRDFLDTLGVPASFKVDLKDRRRQVNRSLTNEERETLRIVNKALGAAYSKELSELLIYANPNARGEPASYNQSTADSLMDRFNDEVNWVNQTFFNGQAVVSVLPDPQEKDAPNRQSNARLEQKGDVEKRVLIWALEKLKTIKDEAEETIANAACVALQINSGKSHPDLPADFDVLFYLLLNRDVLHAGVDPIQHYINYGKQESRIYKL